MEAKEARLRFAMLTAELNTLHETYHVLPGPKRIGEEGKTIREQITKLSRRIAEIQKAITKRHYTHTR